MLLFINPMTILLAAAVIPAIVLLVEVYKYDRLEPEPPNLLLRLVLMGVISTFIALIGERIGSSIAASLYPEDSLAYYAFLMYFVVGLSEEGAKYLMLRRSTWNSPDFNCRYDGVIYAVFVSLGFALWENIMYVFSYGIGTAMLRAVTAIPGHASFGVFMGTWYGLAKKMQLEGREDLSTLYRTISVLLPLLVHGTYDLIATIGLDWIFFVFIAIVFLFSFTTVKRISARDEYL